MELLFIGLLIGTILAYFIFARFNAVKRKASIQSQSTMSKKSFLIPSEERKKH